MAHCNDVISLGSLALEGALPLELRTALADHARTCVDCTTCLEQMATTAALLATHPKDRPSRRSEIASHIESADLAPGQQSSERTHRLLTTLAIAVDPAHAEDLVQDTWDHVLQDSNTPPSAEVLVEHLLRHVRRHQRSDELNLDLWADRIETPRRGGPSDVTGSGIPADPGTFENLQSFGDTDGADPDSESAELLYSELYETDPRKETWANKPVAWPTVTMILGPDAEIQTQELYSQVDSALEGLPADVADAMYLVDMEGHSVEAAAGLLQLDVTEVTRHLIRARHHVRGRLDGYLTGHVN